MIRRSSCTCIFRTQPRQAHAQRCPRHNDATCPCACHLTPKRKRGHICGQPS